MLLWKKVFSKATQLNTLILICSTAILILFSSVFIHILEPKKFNSVFEGLWWTMTTLTTVGYGDFFPETVAGRIWAMFLFCFGVGLFTIAISKVFETFAKLKRDLEEGKLNFNGKGHIVIIGWSGSAKRTIKNILQNDPKVQVVLIDEKLSKIPMEDKNNFFFVKGFPAREKVLTKANIKEAKQILVFAEEKLKIDSPYDADARTAFILTSLERIAPKIPVNAEVILEENLDNFGHIAFDVNFKLSDEAFADSMYPSK
jgi:voltage-gated potassium channel